MLPQITKCFTLVFDTIHAHFVMMYKKILVSFPEEFMAEVFGGRRNLGQTFFGVGRARCLDLYRVKLFFLLHEKIGR